MDACPTYVIEDSDIDDEETWEELDETNVEVDCLFCSTTFSSIIQALPHCNEVHGIDFKYLKVKFNMDCYSFIKLVNFVRQTSTSPELIVSSETSLWDNEIYLKPAKVSDPWLMFDLEDYCDEVEAEQEQNSVLNGPLLEEEQGLKELQTTELAKKNEELIALKNQIILMRNCVHKILQDDSLNAMYGNHSATIDNPYFDSYSNPGIHHDMLSDSVRTMAFKDAILNNESMFAGKTVLDLGCGTGILSMFAASTLSQKVYAVDNSEIAYYATEIIQENNFDSKVDVIKGRIEDDHIEIEKVDIIISEWMGYFLLFEGMLDSLIFARDHYLKPNGILLPDLCSLYICGANDPDGFKNYVQFWSDVYGYRMSSIKREVIKEAVIDVMPGNRIVTSEACISSFNLYKCSVADTNFSSSFELVSNEDTTITTLVGYFDTVFNLENHVQFSTGPLSTSTHWKQTLFYIPEPFSLKKGEKLNGHLTCGRSVSDKRSLVVIIKINGREYAYNIR